MRAHMPTLGGWGADHCCARARGLLCTVHEASTHQLATAGWVKNPKPFEATLENGAPVPAAQVPWMQVGTPFTMTCEVSASVADDITEFEAGNPGQVPVTHYVVGSPGGRFFQRWGTASTACTVAGSLFRPCCTCA